MEAESAEIFSTPDLSDLDPSTQGGYRLLFAREWYVAGAGKGPTGSCLREPRHHCALLFAARSR